MVARPTSRAFRARGFGTEGAAARGVGVGDAVVRAATAAREVKTTRGRLDGVDGLDRLDGLDGLDGLDALLLLYFLRCGGILVFLSLLKPLTECLASALAGEFVCFLPLQVFSGFSQLCPATGGERLHKISAFSE